MNDYVAPSPADTLPAPAPVIESVGAPAVFYATPAPVIESVDTSAVCVAPAPVIEYMASDTLPAPASVIQEASAPAATNRRRKEKLGAPMPAVVTTRESTSPTAAHAAPAPGIDAVASSPADLSADAAAVAAARANEEAHMLELLDEVVRTLPALPDEEALLAGLIESEANLADLAAQSLLIEEAQAIRDEKKPKKAQQAAQTSKKPKTRHRK